jgi:MFS family permease
MAQADATIANVATPSIHADLGASGAVLELVIGGYLIAFAVLLITGARLGQTYGYIAPGIPARESGRFASKPQAFEVKTGAPISQRSVQRNR